MGIKSIYRKICCVNSKDARAERDIYTLNEFRKYFVDTMIPEWQSQYFDFDSAVSLLHQAILEKEEEDGLPDIIKEPLIEVESDTESEKTHLIHRNLNNLTTFGSINGINSSQVINIFSLLHDEYDKINTFFRQMESQLRDRMDEIEKESAHLNESKDEDFSENVGQAFVELYKGLRMLYSYSTLNHTAIYEVLKIYEQVEFGSHLELYNQQDGDSPFSSEYFQRHVQANEYQHKVMLAQYHNSNIMGHNFGSETYPLSPLSDSGFPEQQGGISERNHHHHNNNNLNNSDNNNIMNTSISPMSNPSMQIHYANLNAQYFYLSLSAITDLINKTEKIYCKAFNASPDAARKFLNRPQKKLSQKAVFGLGFWCGFDLALSIVLILLFVWDTDDFNSKVFFASFPIYRGIAQVLLVIWLFGCLVFIWTRYRVNYVFVLGLDPPSALGHPQIFKMAALMTAVWLTSFLLFTIGTKIGFSLLGMSHNLYPLVMLVVYIALIFNPFHMFYRSTRIWLGKTIWQCLLAPITEGAFVHFYVADILTSMPKFFSDAEYIICFYTTGDWRYNEATRCNLWSYRYLLPYTMAFPLLIRFIQCIRRLIVTKDKEHAANAGKYFCSMSVSVFGAINMFQVYNPIWQATRIMWFISFVTATIYLYVWDVLMDWGLGQPKIRSKYFMLRNNLVFKPFIYYLFILLDVVGRFSWTWALTQYPIPGLNAVYVPLVFASIEICRRSMWGILRVENEHLKNCIKYRALRDIALPAKTPTEKRTHIEIEIKKQ